MKKQSIKLSDGKILIFSKADSESLEGVKLPDGSCIYCINLEWMTDADLMRFHREEVAELVFHETAQAAYDAI